MPCKIFVVLWFGGVAAADSNHALRRWKNIVVLLLRTCRVVAGLVVIHVSLDLIGRHTVLIQSPLNQASRIVQDLLCHQTDAPIEFLDVVSDRVVPEGLRITSSAAKRAPFHEVAFLEHIGKRLVSHEETVDPQNPFPSCCIHQRVSVDDRTSCFESATSVSLSTV